MLCDELIAHRADMSGYDISPIVPALRDAQKFMLEPQFAAVAEALSEDYTGLVRVFDRCRLPYPQTWIEVAQADRPLFSKAGIHVPAVQKRPKRVGFLLSALRDDLSAWVAHLFWSFPDGQCSAAAIAVKCDMLAVPPSVASSRARDLRCSLPFLSTPHPGWVNSTDAVRQAMLTHTEPVPTAFKLLPWSSSLIDDQSINLVTSALVEMAKVDWAGEISYMLAVIGLLNSRNAVDAVDVDRSKINKSRARRGQLPFQSYKVLKIAQRQKNRAGGGHDEGHIMLREHFVRGHFKARKTGIFFWHPHLRGDPSHGRVVKDYKLA